MEYERASCCLSVPCPGAYPVPVPSLVSNVIEYLVFQQKRNRVEAGASHKAEQSTLCKGLQYLGIIQTQLRRSGRKS